MPTSNKSLIFNSVVYCYYQFTLGIKLTWRQAVESMYAWPTGLSFNTRHRQLTVRRDWTLTQAF